MNISSNETVNRTPAGESESCDPVRIKATPRECVPERGVHAASTSEPKTAPVNQPGIADPPTFRGQRPVTLTFGTSGLRGLVSDITDLEAYINTRGFLDYLREIGDAQPGGPVCIACDLRPSSDRILRVVARAIEDAGFRVENFGPLPTPALTYYAMQHHRASIMVTGSHIPFDRNGIKFNKSTGEVLKRDEPGILRAVHRVRETEYARPESESLFAADGSFKPGAVGQLPEIHSHARREYVRRYLDFFPGNPLNGFQIVFYQHSAVGRDLFVELLTSLGARVIPAGRSDTFVPVDTEAVSSEQLESLQRLVDRAARTHGPIDAIVSTDGDSDRPLLAPVDRYGRVRFLNGDLLGILVADFLYANTVVIPVSASDAVDRWAEAFDIHVVRTKIGSPYVIEAMQQARSNGDSCVVGWEANGGFLTATDIEEQDRTLLALPTRDAALPLIAALCSAKELGLSLVELFSELPCRFSKAGLLDNFPAATSRALIQRFALDHGRVHEVSFREEGIYVRHPDGSSEPASPELAASLDSVRGSLERFFQAQDGFSRVVRINTLDGVRIFFRTGDIAHIRPSGNAPQLRIYAVADTQGRADAIVAAALREPDGILRRLEADVGSGPQTTQIVSEESAPSASSADQAGFVARIKKNIALTAELFGRGETPEVIGTVSAASAAQQFWQHLLDRARDSFKARAAISFQEDLPTNQAFGLLLLWQRIKLHLLEDRGALVAFVFGDGTRSTPFTETDNAQKPAMATFVRATDEGGSRFISMVELALRYFVPVQQFLLRSEFDGLVVKWGDEVQIPTRDLSGADPLFQGADVVRFVSMREMNADEAMNKDWVGVNEHGEVTAFIPRRPIEKMELLADRGLLQRRDGRLFGGINLGSIAVSYDFLDCLLEEFCTEVNDARARREERPALDPEFFTALTVAAIEDSRQRSEAWDAATAESPAVRALNERIPELLSRLRRAIHRLEDRKGRRLKMVAMDFGDQYWGDIGQHAKIYEFFMALNQDGPSGEVARALAGLNGPRDAQGNRIVNSVVSPRIRVTNSVLINATLSGRGIVERSVLIGTRAGNVEVRDGFDVLSTVVDLQIEPRGGTYKVVCAAPIHAKPGERLTTLFLPQLDARLFRVKEETDLKNKAQNYAVPILGNPLSFSQAHAEMGALDAGELEKCRRDLELGVLALQHSARADAGQSSPLDSRAPRKRGRNLLKGALRRSLTLLTAAFLAGLAASAATITLDDLQRQKLVRLVQTDARAAGLFAKLKDMAKASLNSTPHPVARISTAGKLESDSAKIESRAALEDMKKVYALGYAYSVTSEGAYGDAAKKFVLAWAHTYQPTGLPVDETKLEPLFSAYDLTRQICSAEEKTAVETWLRAIARREMESVRVNSQTAYNNWNSHRLKIVGQIGFLLDDRALIDHAINGFKRQVAVNLRPDGSSFDFHERDALHYHCYDLEPLLSLAIAAHQNGVALYDFQAANGASLRKSVNFLVPFCEGTAAHAEWVNSKIAFDRQRAAAGERKFKIGSNFDPQDAVPVLEQAVLFDEGLKPLLAKLAGQPSAKSPTWETVLNQVRLP